MALRNALDSLKNFVFPPNYSAWIAKSRDYKAKLESSRNEATDQWYPLDALRFAPYKGDIINASHQNIAGAAVGHQGSDVLIELGIEGYLRREDALKLYELAFIADGDVLECGTNKGLSTSIIAHALHDKGMGSLETIELDPANSTQAKENLRFRPGFDRVTFVCSDAAVRMAELATLNRKFGLIFIDHWHGYQATVDASKLAKTLLSAGGYLMFHDFLDPGNADRRHVYGVYQAVLDTIVNDERFRFRGTSGCCAVFQFKG